MQTLQFDHRGAIVSANVSLARMRRETTTANWICSGVTPPPPVPESPVPSPTELPQPKAPIGEPPPLENPIPVREPPTTLPAQF